MCSTVTFVFHDRTFDLLRTYLRFHEKYKRHVIYRHHFGLPLVPLAVRAAGGEFGLCADEVNGIQTCLRHLVEGLSWRRYLWRMPLFKSGPVLDPPLIADSLLLTVGKYHKDLHDRASGLASIVFSEILAGFELACEWAVEAVPLDPLKNELFVPIDVQATQHKWIYERYASR